MVWQGLTRLAAGLALVIGAAMRRTRTTHAASIDRPQELRAEQARLRRTVARYHWTHRVVILLYALIAPLPFRFLLASVKEDTSDLKYADPIAQNLQVIVPYAEECLSCFDGKSYDAYTVPYIQLNWQNLQYAPDVTPSFWLFASNDGEIWFSAFQPEDNENYFMSDTGSVTIKNTSLACLGSNPGPLYVVACITEYDLAYDLGEHMDGPPFNANDQCFSAIGACMRACCRWAL